ncbi:MAG: hypothetical protein V3S38_00240 [Acidimicrobiia bacterium]
MPEEIITGIRSRADEMSSGSRHGHGNQMTDDTEEIIEALRSGAREPRY